MHFREEEKQSGNRWRLFLKTEIELSVYVYIKKVAEKEALLRRGDAIADFCFWENRSLCVRTIAIPSLRSLQIRSVATDRTRTDTVFLPRDFKPLGVIHTYYMLLSKTLK